MGKTTTKSKSKKNPMLDEEESAKSKQPKAVKKPVVKVEADKEEGEKPSMVAPFNERHITTASLPKGSLKTRRAKAMWDHSQKLPKVRINLPLEPGEKDGAHRDVWLNGCHWHIPKGVFVDVPENVADVLDKSYRFTARALKIGTIASQDKQGGISAEEALA